MTEQRLAHIEAQQERVLTLLEALGEKMEHRIRESDAWRKKIERTVYGDGNGVKGHNIRVDRLEQAGERQKWLVRTVMGAVVVLALRQLAELIG